MKLLSLVMTKKGMSLIEVIIAAGVGAILLFAMISMQVNQSKENRFLGVQLASLVSSDRQPVSF